MRDALPWLSYAALPPGMRSERRPPSAGAERRPASQQAYLRAVRWEARTLQAAGQRALTRALMGIGLWLALALLSLLKR